MTSTPKTAEQFAQLAFNLNLLSARQLESIWGELGSRNVPAADLERLLLRRGLLTNYQVKRLLAGERAGYFYGDYKVLYLVGTGTFARVYRAVHKDSGEVVALKVLRKRFSESVVETEQFLREGRMGARLRHPNIVPIYEVSSKKRIHYLVMEFVEGRNLREFIKIRKKLPAIEAVKLITDVTAALAYAFEQGITHRDLKLSNVLIASNGVARLVDFGLATISAGQGEDSLAEHPNPRTIDYAALERATGVRKDDPRSDVYFTGCMLYHMLTGVPPLSETRDRLQRLSISRFQSVRPIQDLEPSLPEHLAMVVNKTLELNPQRRYQAPGELLADLHATAGYMRRSEAADATRGGPIDALSAAGTPQGTVMVVESDMELQDRFREGLKKRGFRVLVMSNPSRAIQRFELEPGVADCVVFSCHGLGGEGVHGFNAFAERSATRGVPAVLLLGPRQGGWKRSAQLAGHRVVATFPLKMKELDSLLRSLIGSRSAA
jgi:serine/threonine-protein kinase